MSNFAYSVEDIGYLEEVEKVFRGTIIWDAINTLIMDDLGISIFVFEKKGKGRKLIGACNWWENAILNYCNHPKTLASCEDLFSIGFSEMVKCLHRYMKHSIRYRFSDVSEIEVDVVYSERSEIKQESVKESLERTFVGRAVEIYRNDSYLSHIKIDTNNPMLTFLREMTRSEAIIWALLFDLRKSTKKMMEKVDDQRDRVSEPKLYEMATSLELASRIMCNIFSKEFFECAERVTVIAGGLYRVD